MPDPVITPPANATPPPPVANQTPPAVPTPPPGNQTPPVIPTVDEALQRANKAESDATLWKGLYEEALQRTTANQTPVANQTPAPVVTGPPGPPQPPNPSAFNTIADFNKAQEKYVQDLTDYRVEQRLNQHDQAKRQGEIQEQFETRLTEAEKVDPEIRKVLSSPQLVASDSMVQVIKQSEHAARLIRYLFDNRKEAIRIYRMSPLETAHAIGRLEADLAKLDVTPNPNPNVSNAPAPIPTVNPGAGGGEVDLDKLPTEDFMAMRNKAEFARRGRRPTGT